MCLSGKQKQLARQGRKKFDAACYSLPFRLVGGYLTEFLGLNPFQRGIMRSQVN